MRMKFVQGDKGNRSRSRRGRNLEEREKRVNRTEQKEKQKCLEEGGGQGKGSGEDRCWRKWWSIRLGDKADGRPGLSGVESSASESRGARIRYDRIFDDEKNKDSMYDDSREWGMVSVSMGKVATKRGFLMGMTERSGADAQWELKEDGK
jgi:hypothetical protein